MTSEESRPELWLGLWEFFFVPTLLSLPSSDYMCYFNHADPIRKCWTQHSCTSSIFSITTTVKYIGKVFHGQKSLRGESTTTNCGVNCQLLSEMLLK